MSLDERSATSTQSASRGPALIGSLLRGRETGLIVILVVLVIAISLNSPRFLSPGNLQDIAQTAAMLVILAAGAAVPVITRNPDLSVASILGLSAFLSADLLRSAPGLPIIVAFLVACAVGLGLGLINGVLVAYGKVPSIVVTLGTLYIYRGVDYLLAGNGRQVNAGDLPPSITSFFTIEVLGFPLPILIAAALVVALALVLRRTAFGRRFYLVGSNSDAAKKAGLPVKLTVVLAFAVSGVLAGFAGALWIARYGAVDSQSGLGLELTALAAVVVGGVAIAGGSGTVVGAALGAVLLAVIQNILTFLDISSFALDAIYGATIVAAVVFGAFLTWRGSRRGVRKAVLS